MSSFSLLRNVQSDHRQLLKLLFTLLQMRDHLKIVILMILILQIHPNYVSNFILVIVIANQYLLKVLSPIIIIYVRVLLSSQGLEYLLVIEVEEF